MAPLKRKQHIAAENIHHKSSTFNLIVSKMFPTKYYIAGLKKHTHTNTLQLAAEMGVETFSPSYLDWCKTEH